MDTPVVISTLAAAAPPSKSGIPAGNALRLDDALRIMLVRSANDIAIAIAETVSGNVNDFVDAMNKETNALGMTGTRFSNPNGLDADDQVTTARDMAVLALAVSYRHKEYADFFRMPFITLNRKQLPNTNELIGKYSGIDGMKTGYICSSGFNLVASASRNGKRFISVILGASTRGDRATMSRALLDLGFSGRAPKVSNLRSLKSSEAAPVIDPPACARPKPQSQKTTISKKQTQSKITTPPKASSQTVRPQTKRF